MSIIFYIYLYMKGGTMLKAYKALKAKGYAVTFENGNLTIWGGADGKPGGYYYAPMGHKETDDFGIYKEVNRILDRYSLFAEWRNPDVIDVYPI